MDYIPAKTIISNYTKDNPWFGINYNIIFIRDVAMGVFIVIQEVNVMV
jgi:hypothetical protein